MEHGPFKVSTAAMAQHYSNPKRTSDPYSLPNVETFTGYVAECNHCHETQILIPDYYGLLYSIEHECSECGKHGVTRNADRQWFYWYCFPGCLPDSDPMGPFASEADAIADARETSGDDDGDDDETVSD